MMKVESLFKIFMRITVLVSLRYFWTESTLLTPATEDSELLCISKHNFLKLITENATISIKIIQILSSVCIIKRLWRQRFRLKILSIDLLLFDCIS
jgi:hypothetical protein